MGSEFLIHNFESWSHLHEHERLSNVKHELKSGNSAFIAVLHFVVTVGSSIMRITHTLKINQAALYPADEDVFDAFWKIISWNIAFITLCFEGSYWC